MSQIPNHFAPQYKNNLQFLLQQKASKLGDKVTVGTYQGEGARVVDQIGAIAMQPVVSRFAPMGRVEAALDSRWVNPSDFELPQLVDSFDKLRLFTDPESMYSQNAVQAANRQKDDLIIAAFFASASTGKTGTTSTAFPAAQVVAVNQGAASNTNLTVAKLREGKRLLMAAQVDLDSDQLICPITAKEHDNLLSEIQVISLDFNEKPVMTEGRVTRFLGIDFVHCERLKQDGSGYNRIPLYAKSGMHLGIWADIQTSMSKRSDLSGEPWQGYVKMSMGATRLEEAKVVEIKCA